MFSLNILSLAQNYSYFVHNNFSQLFFTFKVFLHYIVNYVVFSRARKRVVYLYIKKKKREKKPHYNHLNPSLTRFLKEQASKPRLTLTLRQTTKATWSIVNPAVRLSGKKSFYPTKF
jgi:hypothetical protein